MCEIPRYFGRYGKKQSEPISKLFSRGWTPGDVRRLLGDADWSRMGEEPRFGCERTLLAELSDPSLVEAISRSARSQEVLKALLPDDVAYDEASRAETVAIPGFPPLMVCQRVDARNGSSLEVRRRRRPKDRTVERVYAEWGDFALIEWSRTPSPRAITETLKNS